MVRDEGSDHLPPGFVIGVYRSGSTLLRYILDSHSQIAVPPETIFLHPLAELWRSQWIRNGLGGLGLDETGILERLREFAWTLYDDYARAHGKGRWIDKTPAYVDDLDFLPRLFGDECKYILLYRNGLDSAESLAGMYPDPRAQGPVGRYCTDAGDPARLCCARYWAAQCRKMLAFEAAHSGQTLRLRYEDFVLNPQDTLPPVFEFLGVPWEPAVLDFAEHPHDQGLQDHKIRGTRGFQPRIHTWRTWPKPLLETVESEIREVMEALGYRLDPTGRLDISADVGR